MEPETANGVNYIHYEC